ncbi:MAG: hypothetical protein KJO73_10080 [Croceitalea sp.]|nr:hypothetical protein [Croceitalea sp.]
MPHNFPKSSEILGKASEHGLYGKLLQQLEKDFELANIEFEIHLKILPFELQQQLQEKVYHLLMEKFNDYLNLLYVIDVPEKEFKQIASTDLVEISLFVSYLILKREWQKVWFKSKH